MIDPITLFRDGGPFMVLMLLSFPVAAIGSATPALAAILRRRIPTAVPITFVMTPAFIGVLGWLQGMGMIDGAVWQASPEMVPKLAAMGMSINLFTVIVGGLLTGVLALLAGGLDAAASLMPHREEEQVPATRASRRNGALVLGGIGALGLAVAWVAMRYAMYWQAQAIASAETRGPLMELALSGVPYGLLPAGCATLCFVAALVHALAIPASRTPRTAIGAAVAAAICVPTLALPLVRLHTAFEIVALTTP